MNRKIIGFAMACVLGAGAAAVVWAAEDEKIELDKAPVAVQAAVKKAVGDGKLAALIKESEDGKTVYEAEFAIGDKDHSVKIAESGEVLEEEAEVALDALPAAVLAGVKTKYADGKVEDATMVKAGGKTSYELTVKVGETEHDLIVDASGAIGDDKVEAEHEGDEKDENGEKKDKD